MIDKNVLIAGGSGLIGERLSQLLMENGYTVSILSQKKYSVNNVKVYLWNTADDYIEDGAIHNADYIVNLAGSGIGEKRWTKKRKKEIISSRVNAAKTIFNGHDESILEFDVKDSLAVTLSEKNVIKL